MQGLAAATGGASFPFRAPWNPTWRKDSKLCAHFSNFSSPTPLRLSANSTSRRNVNDIGPFTANQFFGRGLPTLRPSLGKPSKYLESVRVYKDDFFKIKIPKIIEKPEWWWRTLACIPYLISLQISDVGYYLQPFLEKHDAIGDMIYFIPGAITRWPTWFFMAYCYIGYLWVVKNKKLPHYFRFHVMMGMLLETALQIVWCSSNFFPLIHFKGRLGMYYWMAIGFTYICLLLECIRCALAGVYAHIPFISNAAFIHTLFHMS